jgi:hypothetical protein
VRTSRIALPGSFDDFDGMRGVNGRTGAVTDPGVAKKLGKQIEQNCGGQNTKSWPFANHSVHALCRVQDLAALATVR